MLVGKVGKTWFELLQPVVEAKHGYVKQVESVRAAAEVLEHAAHDRNFEHVAPVERCIRDEDPGQEPSRGETLMEVRVSGQNRRDRTDHHQASGHEDPL